MFCFQSLSLVRTRDRTQSSALIGQCLNSWRVTSEISCIDYITALTVPFITLGAHAPKGYGSRSVCLSVCLSVCYLSNCHILGLHIENKVPLGFSWQSQHMYCVDFVENALFKSSGDIC